MKPAEEPIIFVKSKFRVGIEDILDKADIGDFDRWVWSMVASDILRYLHSQGVVIKNPRDPITMQELIDCEVVEPLIKQ